LLESFERGEWKSTGGGKRERGRYAVSPLVKANLTLQIFRALKARKLTQAKAGKILGIPQPHVSDLMRGRARAFSAERLMQFLTALGHDVEIRVKQRRKEHGQVSVVAA